MNVGWRQDVDYLKANASSGIFNEIGTKYNFLIETTKFAYFLLLKSVKKQQQW